MIELHIHLEPMSGKEEALEGAFRDAFLPAVSRQEGFRRATLLKKSNALREYEIDLCFDSEELRLKWVASDAHQEAFPKITAVCQRLWHEGFEHVEGAAV